MNTRPTTCTGTSGLKMLRDRQLERGRGADHRPGPGQEVHAGRHGRRAGQDAPVDAEPIVERQHRRNRDQEA